MPRLQVSFSHYQHRATDPLGRGRTNATGGAFGCPLCRYAIPAGAPAPGGLHWVANSTDTRQRLDMPVLGSTMSMFRGRRGAHPMSGHPNIKDSVQLCSYVTQRRDQLNGRSFAPSAKLRPSMSRGMRSRWPGSIRLDTLASSSPLLLPSRWPPSVAFDVTTFGKRSATTHTGPNSGWQ